MIFMVVETQYFASPAIQSGYVRLDLLGGDAKYCVSTAENRKHNSISLIVR